MSHVAGPSESSAAVHNRDGATVIRFRGDVDIAAVADLQSTVDTALNEAASSPRRLLVLDFADVDFLDSIGIALIARQHNRATITGVTVVVARSRPVVRTLEVSGLGAIVRIVPTLDEAVTEA